MKRILFISAILVSACVDRDLVMEAQPKPSQTTVPPLPAHLVEVDSVGRFHEFVDVEHGVRCYYYYEGFNHIMSLSCVSIPKN